MPHSATTNTTRPHHKGRLQRAPTSTGYRVTTFREVLQRHGATMGSLCAICMILPGSGQAIATTTSRLFMQPVPYLSALLCLVLFFIFWSQRRPHAITRQGKWVLYLLCISIVEEVTFRLIFPALLAAQFTFSLTIAHIISNILFAALHYVTLRWKLSNCIVTFLGALGLSYLMRHGDLTLVVMVHWLGTFLNTPFPPAATKRS